MSVQEIDYGSVLKASSLLVSSINGAAPSGGGSVGPSLTLSTLTVAQTGSISSIGCDQLIANVLVASSKNVNAAGMETSTITVADTGYISTLGAANLAVLSTVGAPTGVGVSTLSVQWYDLLSTAAAICSTPSVFQG